MIDRPGFVKLPRAVLYDESLSPEAIVAYLFLCERADRTNRQRVSVSLEKLAKPLHRHPGTVRRHLRELIARGHVTAKERPGQSTIYRLTHSTDATGTVAQPVASEQRPPSSPATGTPSSHATPLRKRTVDVLSINDNVRVAMKVNEPSDHMVEALRSVGWPAQKIRREAALLYRDIGGPRNERDFIDQLRAAKNNPKIRNPAGYALAVLRRTAASVESRLGD